MGILNRKKLGKGGSAGFFSQDEASELNTLLRGGPSGRGRGAGPSMPPLENEPENYLFDQEAFDQVGLFGC